MVCSTGLPTAGLFALLLAVAACGGQSAEHRAEPSGGNAGGGSASTGKAAAGGGNASGGTATTAVAVAGGGNASGGNASAGMAAGGNLASDGSAQCGDFLDETGSPIFVQLTNGTSKPIYLDEQAPSVCGARIPFQVADASGTPLSLLGACRLSCREVTLGITLGCPAVACLGFSSVTLQPGESVRQQWNAAYLALATPPLACVPANRTAAECSRAVALEPGAFTFSARAGTALDCSQLGECSGCNPNTEGGCTTPGSRPAGEELSAVAEVMLDASYGLGGPGGGTARAVEIVFKE